MKVLMINGSPRVGGNTSIALQEMEKIFAQEGIEVETVQVGNQAIRGCIACGTCAKQGKCVFDDAVNAVAPKFEACDGLVIASPGVLRICQRHPDLLPGPAVLQHPFQQNHEGGRQRGGGPPRRPVLHL